MKVRFINPFLKASYEVLESMAQVKVERGNPHLRSSPYAGYDVTVILGVTGAIEGQVLYGMSLDTAKRLASSIMMGMPVKTFEEMEKSAISELATRITIQASLSLSEEGYQCVITPPTLLIGSGVQVSSGDIQTLLIPLVTPQGEVEINVSLRERSGL